MACGMNVLLRVLLKLEAPAPRPSEYGWGNQNRTT